MHKSELAKRDERSEELTVYKVRDNTYYVESAKGKIAYKVVMENGSGYCTCADFQNNHDNPQFMCKHILAVINSNGNLKHLKGQKTKPKLDERWITRIKGKDFVLYSGLLDLAHQIGLQSLNVEFVQFPAKDNGHEAICRAITHSKDGQMFVDFGDANPKNTNSLVANHILRVAATRAKARTLRDMTNIGMTCLEELGEVDEVQKEVPQPQKSAKKKADKPVEDKSESNGNPSSAQVNAIKNLAYRRGLSDEQIENLAREKLSIPFKEISSNQAGQFIKILQKSA